MSTAALPQGSTNRLRAGRVVVQVEELAFWQVSAERVRIEVRLFNPAPEPAPPTRLALQAATLGAFVGWRPLGTLSVPKMSPGATAAVHTEAWRPALNSLGNFTGVPPRRLLLAIGGQEPPRDLSSAEAPGHGPLIRRPRRGFFGRGFLATLPPDLLELLGRRNPHWAGNLNVFLGGRQVERHVAKALRVYPGRVNLALFCVGCGRDAYKLCLKGEGANWETALYDGTIGRSLVVDPSRSDRISEGTWLETRGTRLVVLALCPPSGCSKGSLDVHVTQRSSGRTATVEFTFDPRADGPGCFAI